MDVAKFVPPGPGSWEIESTHLQRPITRWLAQVFPPNMMRGFEEATTRYGGCSRTSRGGDPGLRVRLSAPGRSIGEGEATAAEADLQAADNAAPGTPPPHEAFERGVRDQGVADDVKRWDTEWKPAIVTDRGGLLSHAAIVAREYGMPAVVGTSDATATVHRMTETETFPGSDWLADPSVVWNDRV